MNTEFIPYEQALELKELGFDELCFGYYENGTFTFWYDSRQDYELLLNCAAPLYQQAFRWFREKHGIDVHVGKNGDKAIDLGGKKYVFFIETTLGVNPSNTVLEDTYEEAELECLKKLIEIVDDKLKLK